ncbi:MAG: sensor domain-containing diguanylate cyclase [Acidimicrobiales bacterium]|nr:sensor domain-containing diguanylate cyclase [Acidimicrobiales bacterium]HRW36765.1 sensor domain-containing diguanylate cyclase [Aquihabitans sp.]
MTNEEEPTLWYAALGHLIDEVVFIHREDRSIAFVSPSVADVLGYTPDEFTALRTYELIHPDDLPEAARTAEDVRSGPGRSYRSVLRIRHRDGSWVWAEVVGRNLIDDPAVQGVVQTLRDISDRRALEEQLAHQARHDGLTGLANRNHFLDQLDAALAGTADPQLAVLYLDLDGFKAINDGRGHRTGDEVLREVARRMAGATRHDEGERPRDVVGRLGGDEFAAFFGGVASDEDAAGVGQRVLEAVSGELVLDGVAIDVRASVGVARPQPGEDADGVLARADAALYEAKRAGRAQVAVAGDEVEHP